MPVRYPPKFSRATTDYTYSPEYQKSPTLQELGIPKDSAGLPIISSDHFSWDFATQKAYISSIEYRFATKRTPGNAFLVRSEKSKKILRFNLLYKVTSENLWFYGTDDKDLSEWTISLKWEA
jgi:hypothetical protein